MYVMPEGRNADAALHRDIDIYFVDKPFWHDALVMFMWNYYYYVLLTLKNNSITVINHYLS
jgi:hypothetical protein